jgi:hypothetical protein
MQIATSLDILASGNKENEEIPVLEVVSTNDILGIWKAGNITAGWIY